MAIWPSFGICNRDIDYVERPASYTVVVGDHETVAVVQGPSGHVWLPGGGCEPGESAEETVSREVREELAREIRLIQWIGEATQYFYASDERCHYRMQAKFFQAAFTAELECEAESELIWLPIHQAEATFFHECHVWAVKQAVASMRMTAP